MIRIISAYNKKTRFEPNGLRMKTDEEFRKKVLECKDAKKRMELVKAEGFDFSKSYIKPKSSK